MGLLSELTAGVPAPEPRNTVSSVTPTSRTAKATMTTSTTPLLPAFRFASSGEGDESAGPASSRGRVANGCEVEVTPELRWEGERSDWATVKSAALAPHSAQ